MGVQFTYRFIAGKFSRIKGMKLITLVFLLLSSISIVLFEKKVAANDGPFLFTILHTNDLHSHVSGSGPRLNFTKKVNDGDAVVGHYARLSDQIKKFKEKSLEPVLTLDAGDWYGGTLYQWLGPRKDNPSVPELEFFQSGEYDFTVLGNHEFDAGPAGLQTMLGKLLKLVDEKKLNFRILATNLEENFRSQLPAEVVQEYAVKEIEYQGRKLKIGLLGLLGPDGQRVSVAQRAGVKFIGFDDQKMKTNTDEFYQQTRDKIGQLKKLGAEAIGVLLHGGTPEDVELAENVAGIDFIIAGHTHELYPTPRKVGRTYIVQAGCYGQWLGVVPLKWQNGQLELLTVGSEKNALAINDSIAVDDSYMEKVQQYDKNLEELLQTRGFSLHRPIVEVVEDKKKTSNYASSVLNIVRGELSREVKEDVDIYFSTYSLIRSGLKKGMQTYDDLFKVFSIGMDLEGFDPGADLYHFYFSKNEVRLLINFLEIYSLMAKNFKPAFTSNLTYRVRSWGIPMINRLADLQLNGKKFDQWPERISMGTNSNIVDYFDKVKSLSYGLVEFRPTDKQGQALTRPIPLGKKEPELFAKGLEREKKY